MLHMIFINVVFRKLISNDRSNDKDEEEEDVESETKLNLNNNDGDYDGTDGQSSIDQGTF